MNITGKNCYECLYWTNKLLTCQANASWTCLHEKPFPMRSALFFLIDGLIGASFFVESRRHWPLQIGWATADTHSSASKTAYGKRVRSLNNSNTHVLKEWIGVIKSYISKHLKNVACKTKNQTDDIFKHDDISRKKLKKNQTNKPNMTRKKQ